jgi:pilus retraction protein PilT
MNTTPMSAELLTQLGPELARSTLLRGLPQEQRAQIVGHATLCRLGDGEVLMEQGTPSDAFFILLRGSLSIRMRVSGGAPVEIAALPPGAMVGEIGLLLSQPRGASAVAVGATEVLRFDARVFDAMMKQLPAFALALCQMLAERVGSGNLAPRTSAEDDMEPDALALEMLPVETWQRFQMLPMEVNGNVLTVGFVQNPSPTALAAVRLNAPGMELRTVHIRAALFDKVMAAHASAPGWSAGSEQAASDAPPRVEQVSAGAPRLDALLRRMVAEGASDLHLSGGQRPRWRIDGEIHTLSDAPRLTATEVYELLGPVMQARSRVEFERDNDADFAYALPGTARFRTNVFRDQGGVSAVLRQIPDKILSFDQLGLPPAAKALCEHPKGLVLVTGPTGSGKSTTLAAMIDAINATRKAHIITLEDPIEFVHASQESLVNQREVGPHTQSFSRALRAALREDPDIVLVGEMRDLETVSLALETANTGHLVFGTLHTATAISTVDRIVNLYPADQQAQVRATLADVLRGVIAQTLCRKIGGGRVAALEVMVSSLAIANLIREGKTHQIATAMTTGRAQGNQTLNEELARLVTTRKVEPQEALSKAIDKADLLRRIG